MQSTIIRKTTFLGEIKGIVDHGVVQFKGVPYATLTDRLADAQLIYSRNGDILDATRYGPSAVSPSSGCEFEQSAIQHELPCEKLSQSDRECLNLNIATPATSDSNSNLPVFLFIHGGGYVVGANSWPQYEPRRFVRLSMDSGKPIVTVSINYRLGVLGFLTSNEMRKAGYKANNGIRDQRVAIEWVHQHIKDFGGDPENITVTGSSAGGASALLHLHSFKPLFQRVISLSGTPLLLPSKSLDEQEESYESAMKFWGLSKATTKERIQFLLEAPVERLLALPPTCHIATSIDGDVIMERDSIDSVADPMNKKVPGRTWCREILVGAASADASIVAFVQSQLAQNCAGKFAKLARSHLPEVEARTLLEDYRLLGDLGDDEAFSRILQFITDVTFISAALAFARGWFGHAYLYHFKEGNPWGGLFQGQASHLLDIAYLLQNYSEYLSPKQDDLAVAFAQDVFSFCYGTAPWPVFDEKANAKTYGPSSEDQDCPIAKSAREKAIGKTPVDKLLERVSWDTLNALASDFKSVL